MTSQLHAPSFRFGPHLRRRTGGWREARLVKTGMHPRELGKYLVLCERRPEASVISAFQAAEPRKLV
jgi:hypothetical protein